MHELNGKRTDLAIMRLAIGLLQGLALFGLYQAQDGKVWPATAPVLFGAVVLTAGMTPLVLLAGVGAVRRGVLAATFAGAVALTVILGAYGVWRDPMDRMDIRLFAGPAYALVTAVALFVIYHLVEPADAARRRIAPYAAYFETAWKRGVQLALSCAFTAVFWGLLFLGASLFEVIGIGFFRDLIREAAFGFTITPVVFAAAVHLADVRSALIQGVRTVALTLLAWLLPLLTLIVAGFLASLPFTGLDPLWSTRSAGGLMLGAAASLIILINAAWQDGEEPPHRVLAVALRVACFLLAPLAALAGWALVLRIGQHGLSPERIWAAACVVIAAGYAAGYILAAVRRGEWMSGLGRANIAMAFVTLALILALFTPIADPMRLSVNDQLHRLERGKVGAEAFDYDFLRFQSGRFGTAALERLAKSDDATTAKQARAALNRTVPEARPNPLRRPAKAVVSPAGRTLPQGFSLRDEDCYAGSPCDVVLRDIDSDGREDILVFQPGSARLYASDGSGGWVHKGAYTTPCQWKAGSALAEIIASGGLKTAPSLAPDLVVEDRRMIFQPNGDICPEARPSPQPPR
ncbi:FG-GAP repeat domain-containing protein [Caulobacter sp. NIBR2454]|uniref:FG-GAP repeat domain-containing protein n=1 Tax=Caulobacter sp. NIBR2454 TaxID=3015996 RepID=UPI0022B6B727|nr:DUF4153 domain-containing protein [Caulobacter sp. NIBR2454]